MHIPIFVILLWVKLMERNLPLYNESTINRRNKMVETWYDVATFVSRQTNYGFQSKFEFAIPIEVCIIDFKSSYRQEKKILVKELRTIGCNFTQNLDMTVIDIDDNHYGMFEIDCGIFQIWKHIKQYKYAKMS